MTGIRSVGTAEPNLFVIGAQRAGSTSMWRYLREHPEIFMSEAKEPGFVAFAGGVPIFTTSGDDTFYDQIVTDEAAYLDLFTPGAAHRYRGESSSFYLYFTAALDELKARFPDARLLVILRDPIDRIWSSYCYLRRLGAEPFDDLADALDAEPQRIAENWEPLFHYVNESRYAAQLERLYERFDRGQVYISVLERLELDGRAELADLFAWLGVATDADVGVDVQHNSSRRSRSEVLDRLLSPGLLPRSVTDRIPRSMKNRAVALRERNRTQVGAVMAEPLRARLADELADDLQRLPSLLDFDPADVWPTFQEHRS